MKKIKKVVLLIILLSAVMMVLTSCNKYVYKGQKIGILELTNNSISTIQEVFINDKSYGILAPGKSKKIRLTPGVYRWELQGLGSEGCKEVTGTIVAGYTQSFNCSVK
jgi:hypothetical protein